jgi:PAS domain S-box-containing protein
VMDTTESHRAEEALRRSENYLAEGQRLTHTGSWAWQIAGRVALHLSEEWYRIYGFDPEKGPPTREERAQRVHPEDRAKWQGAVDRAIAERSGFEMEFRIHLPDGTVKYIHTAGHPVLNASGDLVEFVGSSTDITERKRAEVLLAGEKRLLEMIARGDSRALILEGACRLVEELASGSLSSILLLDSSANCLRHGAAPSLPKTYTEAIDGAVIGPSVGSCGTAAYWARQVIVSDIATDPLWAGYRDLALPHRLRACWSTPILSSAGNVLGTFAIYYREPHSPTTQERHVQERITHLASIAIEREQAEEALRRSEGYLAEAQRLTHTGSWAWNVANRRSVYWSQENYRLFGFDPEGGIPSDEAFYQRVHPEDRDRVRREVFVERPAEGSHFDVVFRIVLPGGEIKYIRSTGHPVRNVSGDILEYVGTSIDVTERKRADEERERLLASERAAFAESVAAQQRFRDLVNSVEGIVWEAEVPSFQLLFISKQAERVLGYPVERWLSDPTFWRDHFHPDDRDWALQFSQTATAEKRDHEFEYRMIAADGSVVWLRDLVTMVVEGDRVTRVRGVMVDLTKRKQAEEALRQAQADLARVSRVTTMGELTASLAHEVNQPIAAAVTNANTCLRWITRDHPDLEEARAAAMRIIKDGTRAAEIIKRTRLLFKKSTPERELVDVNEAVREMIVLLHSEATRYSISFRTDLAADLPLVMGDRVQLQQVLMNLMMNGIEAMKDMDGARELAIESKRGENEHILVSVSDTGVGLPPQQVDQIFNAFFTTKVQGTGMGLSISRTIVESHGGRLWAADNSPRGASFCLTLPAIVEAHENARSRSHGAGH